MNTMDVYEDQHRGKSSVTADLIRDQLIDHAKNFKTSWVELGRALYPVWKDKLFYAWGYDKFEDYTDRELGIKKPTALKLLKTYFFLEQEEPDYLMKEFGEERAAVNVPGCDAINVLRLAKQRRELTKDDYNVLKKSIFEKGKDANVVRKDLTALMKERKEIDPDEERRLRGEASMRRLLNAVRSFHKDMEATKLVPADLIEEATVLIKRLEQEIDK